MPFVSFVLVAMVLATLSLSYDNISRSSEIVNMSVLAGGTVFVVVCAVRSLLGTKRLP